MSAVSSRPLAATASEPATNSAAAYYLILFLVSLSMLGAEVTVTRLLAYKFFFHFVFLVVSLAHLGIAGGGAWIFAVGAQKFSPNVYRRALYGMALAPVLFVCAYVWLAPYPAVGSIKVEGSQALPYLGLLSLLLVGFYFSAGCVLAACFTAYKERFNRLYAADLIGASVGCLGSLGAMALFGPVRSLLASGVLAVAAAALVPDPRRTAGQSRVGSALTAGMALLLFAAWIGAPTLEAQAFRTRGNDGAPLVAEVEYRWTHLARVDRVGASHYIIDGDAGTMLNNPDWVSEIEFLGSRPKPRVAIIGVGAGPQLREALRHDPESVLAVDINPSIVDWSRRENPDFSRADVTVVVDEGRHALRSHPGEFDVIVMHAIDTYTASSMGAYSLSENYLYTVEAFQDCYARLSPDGVMAIRRWLFYPPRENLRLFTTIFAALTSVGVEHPENHLIVLAPTPDWKNPDMKIMGFLMFSKKPFTAERLAAVDKYVEDNGWSYIYRPGKDVPSAFTTFVKSTDREKFYDEYPYYVKPCYDANPFFFQLSRPSWQRQPEGAEPSQLYNQSTNTLFITLFMLTALCVPLLGWPILRARRRVGETISASRKGFPVLELLPPPSVGEGGGGGVGTAPQDAVSEAQTPYPPPPPSPTRGEGECGGMGRPSVGMTLYFVGLGLGFMAVELASIQVMTLFLGHPTYALSVILLGILAFAGLGSLLARMVPRRAAPGVCLLLGGLCVVGAFGLLPLVHACIALSFELRVAVTLGLLFVVGVPLGMPMAFGIREIGEENQPQVAWAWACNGAAGVLGANLCMIVMIYQGMQALYWVAAGCYVLAVFLLPRIAGKPQGSALG